MYILDSTGQRPPRPLAAHKSQLLLVIGLLLFDGMYKQHSLNCGGALFEYYLGAPFLALLDTKEQPLHVQLTSCLSSS